MAVDPSPARALMDRFSAATGLTSDATPRRYLWTDAFAVCTWLGMGEIGRARDLVERVHGTLGRHRPDDPRQGWISGLPEEEGARRPTAGGLRIGKPLPERGADEPYDPRREWDQDGQYFHYLTRWMRALNRMAEATGEARYHEESVELARVAFDRFSHGIGPVPSRLYWKMSIDLSRPQVPSMGQHDPLDGFVTLSEIHAREPDPAPNDTLNNTLEDALGILAGMGDGSDWATEDPLGAGSLLTDAWLLARIPGDDPLRTHTLEHVITAAALSLREVRDSRLLELPAERRLAFRELGLAIGLAAAERFLAGDPARLQEIREALPMATAIVEFWLDPAHQAVPSWREHADINTVMLATALAPHGYLDGS